MEIIKLIVENGKVDINLVCQSGNTPLSLLISSNIHKKPDDVEDDVEISNDNQLKILKDPLTDNLFEKIKYLVSKGANVHDNTSKNKSKT